MAAILEAQPDLLPLSHLGVAEMETLLQEETATWNSRLDWDFRPSADLIRRFLDVRALSGLALTLRSQPIGYAYHVCEEHKGLVGDLYILERFRTPENQFRLLSGVVHEMMRTPRVRRIESQLMLFGPDCIKPFPPFVSAYVRNFMQINPALVSRLPRRALPNSLAIEHWSERTQQDTAYLIAAAYRGHIDSEINDQYRSLSGARRFLFNIIQYPGCGTFFEPAAWAATSRTGGRICGVSLTSVVADGVGHITQICVDPSAKGVGLGYELLCRSLQCFYERGFRKVSLTVTGANHEALRLYERVGFRTVRQFPAMVWDKF